MPGRGCVAGRRCACCVRKPGQPSAPSPKTCVPETRGGCSSRKSRRQESSCRGNIIQFLEHGLVEVQDRPRDCRPGGQLAKVLSWEQRRLADCQQFRRPIRPPRKLARLCRKQFEQQLRFRGCARARQGLCAMPRRRDSRRPGPPSASTRRRTSRSARRRSGHSAARAPLAACSTPGARQRTPRGWEHRTTTGWDARKFAASACTIPADSGWPPDRPSTSASENSETPNILPAGTA